MTDFYIKCTYCGSKMRLEEAVSDYFSPESYYGHGQDISDLWACEGCEITFTQEEGNNYELIEEL